MPNTRTVVVTGAAGTVGGYVVAECLRQGWRVIAVDRPGTRFPTPDVPAGQFATREGDLTDLAFAVDATEGAEAVIHTAATVDLRTPPDLMKAINFDAVRYVYEAARARGAKRFVFFSSGSIYQPTRGPMDESVPFFPKSAYEQSKVDAERYLWSRPPGGPALTVVRPAMIYGPRGRFLGAKMACIPPLLALLRGRLTRISGGPRTNWAHAEDVARAVVFLLERAEAAGQAYNIADDDALGFGDVYNTIVEAYGIPFGREIPYPTRLFAFVGPLLENRDLLLRAASLAWERAWKYVCDAHGLTPALVPTIDRELFTYAASDSIFDNAKLKRLGFEFKYPSFREGYREVLRWYQENRWVPTYAPGESLEWGGATGFKFEEQMAGTWRAVGESADPTPRRFVLDAVARTGNVRQFARDGLLDLVGTVRAEGLAERAEVKAGTLDIAWVRKRELNYDFRFRGDDGQTYRFRGKKDVKLLRFLETMTTLPGRILGARGPVGEALLRFDLRRDLLSLVSSFSAWDGSDGRIPEGAAAAERRPAAAAAG